MKKAKSMSLFLALIIFLSLIAGCNQQTETTPTATPPQQTATPTPAKTGEEQEPTEEDPGPFKLPIVDEKITYTMWNPWNVSGSGITDNNESYAYQEAEKRTNIHIEWFHPAQNESAASFNLSIASGDYYDSYHASLTNFTGGIDSFIEQDIIIDCTDLVAKYAPNYDRVRHLEDTLITTISDGGYLPGFWQIAKTYQWSWLGPLGRTDWLKELGLEIPETYDQFYNVLRAFKDQKNVEIPLALTSTGFDDWLMAGFDTMYNPGWNAVFIQKDGVVKFGALEPGFKEYVTMLNKWYTEGLVDLEFYTRQTNPAFDTAFASAGKVGVGQSLYTFPDFLPLFADDPNFEFNGFRPPVRNPGDKRKIVIGGAPLTLNKGLVSVISTACEDPIPMVKWYDYFFTEDGSLLANYGIEGQGFNFIDGKPKASELIYADKEGRSMNSLFPVYAFNQMSGFWYDWERELSPMTSQNVLDTKDRFDGNWVDEYSMPSVSPTADESAEYSSIINDINTYLSENIIKFIIGSSPMSEFDAFIESIHSMNIARAIEIQQNALDRYYDRLG